MPKLLPAAAISIFTIICLSGCSYADTGDIHVRIETDMGEMVVRLYDETPLHRDNFVKLVNDGFYDGVLFHRVINAFMIQAGDPASVNANPEERLGNGGPGYTIPAEFHAHLFHKKGTLAAARTGDRENPEQASSGSQFYLVQGKTFTEEELQGIETRINQMRQQSLFYKNLSRLEKENSVSGQPLSPGELQQKAMMETQELLLETEPYRIPAEQKEIYKNLGGTPHLDGSYTVFGEIVEGMEVLDKIAAVPTGTADRPLTDVRIRKMTVLK